MQFTLFLRMLAVIAVFALGAVLFFRLRDSASERVSSAAQSLYVPPAMGAQSSTGGWEMGRPTDLDSGSRCVMVSGHIRRTDSVLRE
jgi:hypothetical protein